MLSRSRVSWVEGLRRRSRREGRMKWNSAELEKLSLHFYSTSVDSRFLSLQEVSNHFYASKQNLFNSTQESSQSFIRNFIHHFSTKQTLLIQKHFQINSISRISTHKIPVILFIIPGSKFPVLTQISAKFLWKRKCERNMWRLVLFVRKLFFLITSKQYPISRKWLFIILVKFELYLEENGNLKVK